MAYTFAEVGGLDLGVAVIVKSRWAIICFKADEYFRTNSLWMKDIRPNT